MATMNVLLRAMVVEGMSSGPGSDIDAAYFERLRERIGASRTDTA